MDALLTGCSADWQCDEPGSDMLTASSAMQCAFQNWALWHQDPHCPHAQEAM
jgi:hypothetical protein